MTVPKAIDSSAGPTPANMPTTATATRNVTYGIWSPSHRSIARRRTKPNRAPRTPSQYGFMRMRLLTDDKRAIRRKGRERDSLMFGVALWSVGSNDVEDLENICIPIFPERHELLSPANDGLAVCVFP